jgi:adenylate cyclase
MSLYHNIGVEYSLNLFTNYYTKIQTGEKIVMFIDMNNSTQLGELLGNIRFMELEQQLFKTISEVALITSGSIYECHGDEVVIVWSIKNGTINNNCIQAFYLLEQYINDNSVYYLANFGTIPTFKAAIHCGKVVLGVKGLNEAQVKYYGMVFNACGRIIGLCHTLNRYLLVSSNIKDLFSSDKSIKFEEHGNQTFKGITEPMLIYSAFLMADQGKRI